MVKKTLGSIPSTPPPQKKVSKVKAREEMGSRIMEQINAERGQEKRMADL